MAKYQIVGMKELEKAISTLEKLPQKCVTKAAKKGANISLKDARKNAPEGETGMLKKGIVIKGERSRYKSKKVYQVGMDHRMNDIFVKSHKARANNSNLGKGKAKLKIGEQARAYYPASQEYGFFARNGRYIPGFHYLKNSLVDNKPQIEKEIVNVLSKEIDKLK